MKKLTAILLSILLALSAFPCMADSFGFHQYQLNELYYCNYIIDKTLSKYLGHDVVEIEYLSSVIPSGKGAWAGLDYDVELVIPEEIDGYPVASLWTGSIDNYNRLPGHIVSITLPDSLVNISDSALSNACYLTEIVVSPDHPYLEVIDGALFSKPDKRLICYPAARPGETYVIPEGTLSIAAGAFARCSHLKEITIPDSVTAIGENAFSGCSALTTLTIGSGLPQFPAHAIATPIRYDYNLSQTNSSFLFSPALQEINVSPDNPSYTSIDGVLFDKSGATLLCYPIARDAAHYTIPDHVTAIAPGALCASKNLVTLSLPDSFTFTEGEAKTVYIYPIAISDERLQAFMNAASRRYQTVIRNAYKKYNSVNGAGLISSYPALAQGAELWLEKKAAMGDTLRESDQKRLAEAFADAGYTADDLLIDDANLATGPRSLYPFDIVCHQLTGDVLLKSCVLLVQENSLAHHWALQNGYSVAFKN